MPLFLVGLGAFATGLAFDQIAENVFGVKNARANVQGKLNEILGNQEAEQTTSESMTIDAGMKHVSEEPKDHSIEAVSQWLRAIRAFIAVHIRVYIGSGMDATIAADTTVCNIEWYEGASVETRLHAFLDNVLQNSDWRDFSIAINASSLDKDSEVETTAANLIANAIHDRINKAESGSGLSHRVNLPCDHDRADDIAPGTILLKSAPAAKANDETILLDESTATGQMCNILVTGESASTNATVCNVLAQSPVGGCLFPITKFNNPTFIRSVKALRNGVTYRICNTPGFDAGCDADPIITCELWNLTREIDNFSSIVYVVEFDRNGKIKSDFSGLRKYIQVVGQTALKRLLFVVAHKARDDPRRTVDDCATVLAKIASIPRTEAEKRIMTIDLTSARAVGLHPTTDDTTAAVNLRALGRMLEFSRSGSQETACAIHTRRLFEKLSRDPDEDTADALRQGIVKNYIYTFRAGIRRIGVLNEGRVRDFPADSQKVGVSFNGGLKLLGGKHVVNFEFHFTQPSDKRDFVKQNFNNAEAICAWFEEHNLAPMTFGHDDLETCTHVQTDTYIFNVIPMLYLSDARWFETTNDEIGENSTANTTSELFLLILQNVFSESVNE